MVNRSSAKTKREEMNGSLSQHLYKYEDEEIVNTFVKYLRRSLEQLRRSYDIHRYITLLSAQLQEQLFPT